MSSIRKNKELQMSEVIIQNNHDITLMLDEMLENKFGEWWNSFYADKKRQIPFLVNFPDENLIEYLDKFNIKSGFALDIGCGNGRNSWGGEGLCVEARKAPFPPPCENK